MSPRRHIPFRAVLAAVAVTAASAADPPVITRHPVPQRVVAGHRARLIGGTSSLFSTFQWEKDGSPVGSGTELILRNASPADSGDYRLVITDARDVPGQPARGESISLTARVDVVMPPQMPGAVDLAWRDAVITGTDVRALVPTAAGGWLIAGDFDSVDGTPVKNLALLKADGTLDRTSLTSGADQKVRALIPVAGGFLAGGDFASINGRAISRLARLDASGAVLPAAQFTPPVFTSNVRALATQKVGTQERLLVATSSAPWLRRLTAAGAVDTAFDAAITAAGLNGRINSILVQPDGRILLGGNFFQDAAWPFNRVGRLLADGTPDSTGFASGPGTGADFEVLALALSGTSRLAVGGRFTQIAGGPRFYLARLFLNGQLDDAFNPAPNEIITTLATDSAGRLLAGGDFSRIGGLSVRSLALLSQNGAPDPDWSPPAFDSGLLGLAVAADGRIMAAGKFDQPHHHLVRLLGQPVSPGPALVGPPVVRQFTLGSGGTLPVPVAATTAADFSWVLNGRPVFTSGTAEWPVWAATAALAGHGEVTVTDGPATLVIPFDLRISPPSPGARPQQRLVAPGLPKAMPNQGLATATVTAPALTIDEVRVQLDIQHHDTNDLVIDLVSPDGLTVRLVDPDVPASIRRGRNFDRTLFAQDAPDRINDAAAPFAGTFRPSAPLPGLAAFAGPRPAGDWTLRIEDLRTDSNTGTLRAFVLELFSPAPAPSAAAFASLVPPAGAPPACELLPGPAFRLLHWAPPPGKTLRYQSSENLSLWSDLPSAQVTTVRRFPDQLFQATLTPAAPLPAAVYFRAIAE